MMDVQTVSDLSSSGKIDADKSKGLEKYFGKVV
jgi:hypothetical protein